MKANSEIQARIDGLLAAYGNGETGDTPTGNTPTGAQWRHVLQRDATAPITLINFFKIRDQAAFDRYAETSIPAMQAVGGEFLLIAPFEGMFLGEAEDWDLVAIGRYPNVAALLELFDNPDYAAAFPHRTVACARQKVMICNG